MTRRRLARELGIGEAKLRLWESFRLLPPFTETELEPYAIRVLMIRLALKAGLSIYQVRRGFTLDARPRFRKGRAA